MNDRPQETPRPTNITIPYVPREHFKPLHASSKRFIFVCAHRRAGKSVSEFNHLLRAALSNPRKHPPPRYAYVGPSFTQTKDLIWGYAKHYTQPIPGVTPLEGDLQLKLPNGALINLYGGAAGYERMRGMYFDGIVLDEFPLLNPRILTTVVRPCLADYRGWCIVSGTSNGDDHFADLLKKARLNPDEWDIFIIPVTDTDALHPDEVAELRAAMSPEEFAREMMCSFDAPVEGSYYGDEINKAYAEKRVTRVPYDPSALVVTAWDLGIDDNTSIWFIQRVGRELHAIDFYENTGKGLNHYANVLKEKGYTYGAHVGPHDLMARELGTGRSRYEVLNELLGEVMVADMLRVDDGINAVRSLLPMFWFDEERCAPGLSALKNYSKTKTGQPNHNWASHGADAFRTFAVSANKTLGFIGSRGKITHIGNGQRLRRRIRGIY